MTDPDLGPGNHEHVYPCPPESPICMGEGECVSTAPLMCLDELVATHSPRAGTPTQVVDLNGDGLSDVLFEDDLTIWVVLARGDRSFGTPTLVSPMETTWAVAADADGDGTPDLMVTKNGAIFLAHGNGDGSFSAPQPSKELEQLPLAAVNDAGPYYAFVDAAGPVGVQTDRLSFSSPALKLINPSVTFPLRRHGPLVVSGFDGRLNLLSDEAGPAIVTFQKRPKAPTDYDEDGNTDLFADGVLQVGNGDGTFTPKGGSLKTDDETLFVAADFDQDGHADLKLIRVVDMGAGEASSITTLRGAGNGQFAPSPPFYVQREIVEMVLPARIDRSGAIDLVVDIYRKTGPKEIRILRGQCP